MNQAPGVGLAGTVVEVGGSVVFGIKEDNVDTDGRGLQLYLTGYLEQHSDAAGSVIGSVDGGVMLLFFSFIGIGTGIPVCAEQHALAGIGVIDSDQVAGLQQVPS